VPEYIIFIIKYLFNIKENIENPPLDIVLADAVLDGILKKWD